MAKKKLAKIPVGTCVNIIDKKYRHCKSAGVVTESFSDMIQIYGVEWREDLGYHEFDLSEVDIVKVEPDKIRFVFEQAVRDIEQKTLRAEFKYKELKAKLDEVREDTKRTFAKAGM